VNIVEKILMQNVYLTAGVVPIDSVYADVNKALQGLSPAEQRKMKRKFRKMWRKLARARRAGQPTYARRSLGLGSREPTKVMKKNRKHEVKMHIYTKVVRSMLENSSNISL